MLSYNEVKWSYVKSNLIEPHSSQPEQNWSESVPPVSFLVGSASGSALSFPLGLVSMCHLVKFYPPVAILSLFWQTFSQTKVRTSLVTSERVTLMEGLHTAYRGCIKIFSFLCCDQVESPLERFCTMLTSLLCEYCYEHVLSFISACVANRNEHFTVELKNRSALLNRMCPFQKQKRYSLFSLSAFTVWKVY